MNEGEIKWLEEHDKRGRAEVLAAVANFLEQTKRDELRLGNSKAANVLDSVIFGLRALQPAASDLEELLDKAHKAALPHAAEQLLKALTGGGEFAVGSPLARVKERVEELLRKARLDGGIKEHHFACVECQTEGTCHHKAELEKARASLEKP